jgi:hypothetical protein
MLRRISRPAKWSHVFLTRRYLSSVVEGQPVKEHDNATTDQPVKRKRGRPRKVDDGVSPSTANPASLITRASSDHHDLETFLDFTKSTALSTESTVYKGTHYEYTVASSLRSFGFKLDRTGRSNDLGIDLVGTFAIPASSARQDAHTPELRVILQCKAVTPQPSMVRELEGAYVGAPAGWRDGRVLALLVVSGAATKGVRAAVQRSRWPMGLMQVTKDGWLRQWIWNTTAAEAGLEGVGVVARHGPEGNGDAHSIAMTWMNKVVKPRE